KRLFCVFSALACAVILTASAMAQAPNVTGDWDVTINSPQGAREGKLALKQDGEKLTGLLKNQRGELPIEGTVKGKEIKIKYTASSAPTAAAAQSSGEKGGDKVDVTGAWSLTVETEAGSGNPSFNFKQEGEKLTGKYKGAFGEADLTGTVKANKIEFSFKVSGQVEGVVTYTGETDGKTMKGKVNLAGVGEGTFSGKKQ